MKRSTLLRHLREHGCVLKREGNPLDEPNQRRR